MVKTGEIDDINVYKLTPEKLEAYKTNLEKFEKNENKKEFWGIVGGLALTAGIAALGACLGPKVCKSINIRPNSWAETFLGNTKEDHKIMCALWSGLASLASFAIYQETKTPPTAEKLIKETLGEPIKA